MDTQLIVRLIVSGIAAINMFAAAFGFNPLPIEETDIYTIVSAIGALAAWVWGFWKNNNFTAAAKEAQEFLEISKSLEARVDEEDLVDDEL